MEVKQQEMVGTAAHSIADAPIKEAAATHLLTDISVFHKKLETKFLIIFFSDF